METLFDPNQYVFWFVLGIALFIGEMLTPGIFFMLILGIAAIIAGVSAIFIDGTAIIIGIFALSSLLGLILVRPFFKKHLKLDEDVAKSGVGALIGEKGVVVKKITKSEKGLVKVKYEDWTAASVDAKSIEENEIVEIVKIEGVTAYVKKVEKGSEE